MHLAQAEETYLKFSDNHESTANLVEIKRLKMVLLAYSNDPKEAQLARPQMTKLVAYAADQLLPTERQLKLLLSSATVLRVGGEGDLAV